MTGAHVLILAGTGEGRQLASRLAAWPGLRVTSALAGRTPQHAARPGDVRVGGFGGAAGLAAWLRLHRVAAVVDATHPFAQTISAHAAVACAESGTPLITLLRPPYAAGPGDDWHQVSSMRAAAELLPSLGQRVFLTTGQQGLAAFAALDQMWFLIRCITAPAGPLPAARQLILDPGPYAADTERALMERHRIGALVTRDSGGALTAGKLLAARDAGIPVVMVGRPSPAGPTCQSAAAAEDWLATQLGRGRGR